ncbi:hypothetical protein C0992_004008 [Termitomyces sp. T32_za158]|nr:hypothetical protein C0992_004008 [Termitomyces sp. T32_za158]
MSASTSLCPSVSANPDVSGIGVRTAIYAQNFLSFIPAIWSLKDGRITPTELDELEKQSTTMLITAFAILISTIIQAHNHGISDYHASIVLDLSWMNNTNLFIYFLLYIYHRVNLSEDEFNKELNGESASHAPFKGLIRWIYQTKEVLTHFISSSHHALSKAKTKHPFHLSKEELDVEFGESVSHAPKFEGLTRWTYETKKASQKFVIIIGSLHLTLMAAVGLWLWSHPARFGGSGLCSLSATMFIFGQPAQLGSSGLRIWCILVHSVVLIPMMNLLLPIALFAPPFLVLKHIFKPLDKAALYSTMTGLGILAVIDTVLMVDTEVAIKYNINQFHLVGEAQWTFGQTLAVLLLLVALRDLIESILEKRAKQLDKQLVEACKNRELKSVESLLRRGARRSALDDCVWKALENGYLDVFKVLLDHQANPNSKDLDGKPLLHFGIERGNYNMVKLLLEHRADVNLRGGVQAY